MFVVYLDALAAVVPVLLLFALGFGLRRRGLIRPSTADDLRGLVLNAALPAALFLTFLRVEVDPSHLVIAVTVFLACLAALAAGPVVGRAVGIPSPLFAPLLTGFEAGMLGYGIFGAVFGTDALYRFALVDIGQVVFVFFVLVTVLRRRVSGRPLSVTATATAFIRTPVIVAILGGVAAGSLGLGPVLDAAPAGRAVLSTLALLAALTTPLIAIVIGASIRLSRHGLGRPIRTVAVRMSLWVALGLAFNLVVVEGALGLDPLFGAAVLTMAVLPPPFVIPLYLSPRSTDIEERDFVTNTLSIGTIATLVAFSIIAVAYAPHLV